MPSNNSFRKIFNAMSLGDEEEVFWSHHCKEVRPLKKTLTFNELLNNFVSSCPQWLDSDSKKDDFWQFFLKKSNAYIILTSTINLLMLLAIFAVNETALGRISLISERNHQFSIELFDWIIITGMCWLFAIVYKYRPRLIILVTGMKYRGAFQHVGLTIIFLRALNLAIKVGYSAANADRTICPLTDQPQGHVSGVFPLLIIITEFVEMTYMATLPFPWPWGGIFVLTESLHQAFWLRACYSSERIGNLNWMLPYAYSAILVIALISLFASSALESSIINSYMTISRQSEIGKAKVKFVDMLCSDMRNSVNYITENQSTLDKKVLSARNRTLIENAMFEAQQILQLSDDWLLISKIAEGRMVFDGNKQQKLKPIVVIKDSLKKFSMMCGEWNVTCDEVYCAPIVLTTVLNNVFILIRQTAAISLPTATPDKLVRSIHVSVVERSDMEVDDHTNSALLRVMVEASNSMVSALACQQSTFLMTCRCLTSLTHGDFAVNSTSVLFTVGCIVPPPSSPRKSIISEPGHNSTRMKNLRIMDNSWVTDNRNNRELSGRLVAAGSGRGSALFASAPQASVLGHAWSNSIRSLTSSSDTTTTTQIGGEVSTRVAIVSDNDQLVSSLAHILEQLQITDIVNFESISELTNFDDIDLLLVSDSSLSADVRATGYANRLVLFQGGTVYLDNQTIGKFDYVVPFPCLETDVQNFTNWIANEKTTVGLRRATIRSTSDDANVHSANTRHRHRDRYHYWLTWIREFFDMFHNRTHFYRRVQALNEHANLSEDMTNSVRSRDTRDNHFNNNITGRDSSTDLLLSHVRFGMPVFTSGQEESFVKWRLFNPTQSIFHYSYVLEAKAFCYMGLIIVDFIINNKRIDLPLRALVLLSSVCILCRKQIYHWLVKPMDIKVLPITSWYCIFLMLVNIVLAVMMFFDRSGGKFHVSLSITVKSVAPKDFSDAIFGAFDGRYLIEAVYACIIGNLPWAVFFPWPDVVYYSIATSLRIIALVVVLSRVLVDSSSFVLIMLLTLLFTILRNITFYLFEYANRQEYMELRRTIFSNVFMQTCAESCKRDMQAPIIHIVGFKNQYVNIVNDLILDGKIPITPLLIRKVKCLSYGQWALKYLLAQLDYDFAPVDMGGSSSDSTKTPQLTTSQAASQAVTPSVSWKNTPTTSLRTAPPVQTILVQPRSNSNHSMNNSPSKSMSPLHTLAQLTSPDKKHTPVSVKPPLAVTPSSAPAGLTIEGGTVINANHKRSDELLEPLLLNFIDCASAASPPKGHLEPEFLAYVDPIITYVSIDLEELMNTLYWGWTEAKRNIERAAKADHGVENLMHCITIRLLSDPKHNKINFQHKRVLTVEIVNTGPCHLEREASDELSWASIAPSQCLLYESTRTDSPWHRRATACRQVFQLEYYNTMKSHNSRGFTAGVIKYCSKEDKAALVEKCDRWTSHNNNHHNFRFKHLNNRGERFLFIQELQDDRACAKFAEENGWIFGQVECFDKVTKYALLPSVDCIAIDCRCQISGHYWLDDVTQLRALGYNMVVMGVFDNQEDILPEHSRFDIVVVRSELNRSITKILQACTRRCLGQLFH